MKYYIIFQPSIKSIGGEEMYTRNKIISAREQGYTPIVIHENKGSRIFVEELRPFLKNYSILFKLPPSVFPKIILRKVIHKMLSWIPDYNEGECIIESHEVTGAEWAELLAAHIKAKHLAYMLLEHHCLNEYQYRFFKYKYDRKELVGITSETVPQMFEPYIPNIEGYFLKAYCNNTLADIDFDEKLKVGQADYTIGTIGRTNKEYVQPMLKAVIEFILQHKEKYFNFIYVGGAQDKDSEKNVIKKLSNISNLKFYLTGLIYPIPIGLVKQMDVCLASAGSCMISDNCGIPTIAIDGNDYKGIGIFQKTCVHSLFRGENEPAIELEHFLNEVLIDKKFHKEDKTIFFEPDFTEHWAFVQKMSDKREYYDVRKIKYSFRNEVLWVAIREYLGNRSYLLITSVLERIRNLYSNIFKNNGKGRK